MFLTFFVFINIADIYLFVQRTHKPVIGFAEFFTGVTPYLSEKSYNLVGQITKNSNYCKNATIIFSGESTTYGNMPLIFADFTVDEYYGSMGPNSTRCEFSLQSGSSNNSSYSEKWNTSVVLLKSMSGQSHENP